MPKNNIIYLNKRKCNPCDLKFKLGEDCYYFECNECGEIILRTVTTESEKDKKKRVIATVIDNMWLRIFDK